jgi:hypothetical protein
MRRVPIARFGAVLAAAALVAGLGATGTAIAPVASAATARLPDGGRAIFPGHVLVAYYGTAGTGVLGVLGEDTPDRITKRLRAAARPFAGDGRTPQIVYELIVTVADGTSGPDGDYSHDIAREAVSRYIAAAHRNKALLVLDLQPGRSGFLPVARRWTWALRDPWVGLALDPEWRMGPTQVPARSIGHVRASEVNSVSKWLNGLTVRNDLPQKLFLIHQFRTEMVTNLANVVPRTRLAMVQHVDGFGSQSQKLSTYHTVARAKQFHMGFKLFYDEDYGLMSPRRVLAIRPRVSFVSYQ